MSNDSALTPEQQIECLRILIDETDSQILNLISDRVKFAEKIGKIKAQNGMQVYVPQREKQLLDALRAKNEQGSKLPWETVSSIYQLIIDVCRNQQIS